MSARRVALLLIAAWPLALPGTPASAQEGVAQTIRYGTVVEAEQTVVEVKTGGRGGQTGATVGAVAGYALADGRDRWLGALVGGALGGAAGRAAEKSASKKKGWQLIIELEKTGETIGIEVAGKKKSFKAGDRVRLMTGPDGRTKVKVVE
jgi:outer membrane lipoprotein SlyB